MSHTRIALLCFLGISVFLGVALFALACFTDVCDFAKPAPTGPEPVDTVTFLSSYGYSSESHSSKTRSNEHRPNGHGPNGPKQSYALHVWFPRSMHGPRPLIFFAHGYRANGRMYRWLLEDLASWNYIVVAVDCPLIADHILTPSGAHIDAAPFPAGLDAAQRSAVIAQACEQYHRTLDAALEQLVQLSQQKNGFFEHLIDWENIIAMGHSIGGAVAFRWGDAHGPVRGIVSLDGWNDSCSPFVQWKKPCLFLAPAAGGASYYKRVNCMRLHQDVCEVAVIPTTRHATFSDALLWNRVKRWWYRSKIVVGYALPYPIIDSVRTCVRAWIDQSTHHDSPAASCSTHVLLPEQQAQVESSQP